MGGVGGWIPEKCGLILLLLSQTRVDLGEGPEWPQPPFVGIFAKILYENH